MRPSPLHVLAALLALTSPALAAGPITKGPWIREVTSNSAVLRVETDPPQAVQVEMGVGLLAGEGHATVDSPPAPIHVLPFKALREGTRYEYTVKAGGTQKAGAFVTAPPEASNRPFKFLVYGDNRADDVAHAAVVRQMVPVESDFLIHTGDLVENGAARQQWQNFFDIEAPLLATRAIFSTVGDHELTDGTGVEFLRYFGVPQEPPPPKAKELPPPRPDLDSTFRWSNARFFMLNARAHMKGTPDRAWLERVLTEAHSEGGLRWRILVVHHGPWSSGPSGGNALLKEGGLIALLKREKVDLVISGHDHIYERGWANGLPYLVSGGGGAPPDPIKRAVAQSRKAEGAQHFVEVEVSSMTIQLLATRRDGSTIERCGLQKGASAWDCDALLPAPAGSADVDPAEETPPDPPMATPSSKPKCGCDAVGADTAAPGALAALAALGALARARRAGGRARKIR